MENLLGWFFLLLIFCFIILWSKKFPNLAILLITAFFIRAILVIFEHYDFINLPDTHSDAKKFQTIASEFSKNNSFFILFYFLEPDSLLISRIISIFYSVFGESVLMAKSISVALGTASVYLVFNLTLMLWDYPSAKKAAWVAAIFPTLVLYSCITLREAYIVFFLLFGCIGLVKFFKKNSFSSFLQIVTSFFILGLFHGPLLLGGILFLFFFSLKLIKKQLLALFNLKLKIFSFILTIILFIPLILILSGDLTVPYFTGYYNDINLIIYKANIGIKGLASYPSWLIMNNENELLIKIIFRIIYFLYSPFIWDIKSSFHLFGLLDGILYLILSIYLIKNWRLIWENPIARFFILLIFFYLIIYALGVGNFGTGIRHRSKLVVLLIVLAAPRINKFIFSAKKKIYKS